MEDNLSQACQIPVPSGTCLSAQLLQQLFILDHFSVDYTGSLSGLEGDDREEQKRLCHLRCADKLQRLCFANGGIYIKLGQVAAQMV